jgi:hypothetical protein
MIDFLFFTGTCHSDEVTRPEPNRSGASGLLSKSGFSHFVTIFFPKSGIEPAISRFALFFNWI